MNTYPVTHRRPTAVSRLTGAAPLLIGLPIAGFTALLLGYAVNVPWMDDIDAFLNFLVGYIDARTVGEKIDWLLRPNNEHRILTAKLITLVQYYLTGAVNFRWLIFSAYAFLLALLYLFYRVFRSMNLPLLAFVPVPFLLLQPQYYLTSIWALTGLQHQVVVFITFAGFYLLASGSRNRFVGATALQLLASLSMSNGLFGWVAGAVMLALQRHWLRLGAWLAVGVATIIFYFHDFQSPQGNESSFSFFLHYPYLVFSGFFTFMGALFDFFPDAPIFWRSVLPTLAGLVLVLLLVWLLWHMNEPLLRRYAPRGRSRADDAQRKRRYFFTACYVFLLVNAAIVAFLRPRMGYYVMLVSNYMLYPAVLVVLLYLTVLNERSGGRRMTGWFRVGLGVSLFVWSVSYVVHWPRIAFRKQGLLTNAFNQQHNDIGLGATWNTPFARAAGQTMRTAVGRGVYRYPDAYPTPYTDALVPGARAIQPGTIQPGTIQPGTIQPGAKRPTPDSTVAMQISGGGYSYYAETTTPPGPPADAPSAVVVQSASRTYLFVSEAPYDLRSFWLRRPAKSVRAEVVNSMLAPDTYRVGVLLPSDGGQPLRFSRQRITIP